MTNTAELTEALTLLAEHGGAIEFFRLDDGSTVIQVWFQSMDIAATSPVDPADGKTIARVVVEFVRQFCEQWARRN